MSLMNNIIAKNFCINGQLDELVKYHETVAPIGNCQYILSKACEYNHNDIVEWILSLNIKYNNTNIKKILKSGIKSKNIGALELVCDKYIKHITHDNILDIIASKYNSIILLKYVPELNKKKLLSPEFIAYLINDGNESHAFKIINNHKFLQSKKYIFNIINKLYLCDRRLFIKFNDILTPNINRTDEIDFKYILKIFTDDTLFLKIIMLMDRVEVENLLMLYIIDDDVDMINKISQSSRFRSFLIFISDNIPAHGAINIFKLLYKQIKCMNNFQKTCEYNELEMSKIIYKHDKYKIQDFQIKKILSNIFIENYNDDHNDMIQWLYSLTTFNISGNKILFQTTCRRNNVKTAKWMNSIYNFGSEIINYIKRTMKRIDVVHFKDVESSKQLHNISFDTNDLKAIKKEEKYALLKCALEACSDIDFTENYDFLFRYYFSSQQYSFLDLLAKRYPERYIISYPLHNITFKIISEDSIKTNKTLTIGECCVCYEEGYGTNCGHFYCKTCATSLNKNKLYTCCLCRRDIKLFLQVQCEIPTNNDGIFYNKQLTYSILNHGQDMCNGYFDGFMHVIS